MIDSFQVVRLLVRSISTSAVFDDFEWLQGADSTLICVQKFGVDLVELLVELDVITPRDHNAIDVGTLLHDYRVTYRWKLSLRLDQDPLVA